MTLRFLLSLSIIDDSYGFKINGITYSHHSHIPREFLDRVVRKVVPATTLNDSVYKIYFERSV